MKAAFTVITINILLIGFIIADAGAQRRGGGGVGQRGGGHAGAHGGGHAGGGRGGFVPVNQRGPAYWEAQRRGTPAHWDLVYGTQPTYGNQGYYGNQFEGGQRQQGASGPGPGGPDARGSSDPGPDQNRPPRRSAMASGSLVTDSGMGHLDSARKNKSNAKRRRPLRRWSPGTHRARGRSVRRDFGDYDAFTSPWCKRNGVWFASGWTARAAWSWAAWDSVVGWYDITDDPCYYDYGNSIMYDDGEVYVDNELYGTDEEYYEQADALATTAYDVADDAEWRSFGVYGVVPGDQRTTDKIIQLACHESGAIRGTYYDLVADETHVIQGGIDPATQRVSWTIGDKKTTICETGLDNLTRDEAPVLVMRGHDKPRNWLMIRLGPDEP